MTLPNHTQISNAFIEHMSDYRGNEVKVFLAICRKTIGWHKVSDKISYSQLAELTGLSPRHLKKHIAKLVLDGWIIQSGGSRKGYVYDLNMDNKTIDKKGIPKTSIDENGTTYSQNVARSIDVMGTTKERKKLIKRNIVASEIDPSNDSSKKSKKETDPRIKTLISYFHDKFKQHEGHAPTVNGGSWGKCFKTLLRNHSEETICKIIDIFFSYSKRTRFSFNAFYSTFDNLIGRVLNGDSNSAQDKICPDCKKSYVGSMCSECGWSV